MALRATSLKTLSFNGGSPWPYRLSGHYSFCLSCHGFPSPLDGVGLSALPHEITCTKIFLTVLEQKRPDEAWKIVARLHHKSDDVSESFARDEFDQMSQQVEVDEALAADESWLALFKKPSYRKRVICAFIMMYAGQASGNLVIASTSSTSLQYCSEIVDPSQIIAS